MPAQLGRESGYPPSGANRAKGGAVAQRVSTKRLPEYVVAGLKLVTAQPTALDGPAMSVPGCGTWDAVGRKPIRRSMNGRPVTTRHTSGCADVV